MRKIVFLIVAFAMFTSTALAGLSQELTFKTKEKAPASFSSWVFFWKMPKIDEGATLEYVVIQPDGKEYYRYTMASDIRTGACMRSDFAPGVSGEDPSVFFGKDVLVKFKVDKGQIEFPPDSELVFEFHNSVQGIKQ